MTDPDLHDPNVDRAYRGTPRDEPPPELDERIRAAARRAVGTQPQSLAQQAADERRRSWASRWRVPLSVAATVVIAVTLTVMVQEEERRPRDDAGRNVVPSRVEPREVEEAAKPSVPEAPEANAPAKLRSAPPPAAAPAVPPRPAPAAPTSAAEPAAPRPFREERATEAQQPAAAESGPAAAGQLEMRRQAPAPAASTPAAPAPAPEPRPLAKPAQRTAPASSEALRRDRTLGDRPERASREAVVRSPEAWVEHIRSLRAQGREAEATSELAELRRAYPDFQLPTDLAR